MCIFHDELTAGNIMCAVVKYVNAFAEKHQLNNNIQLPYQPIENIHIFLGPCDVQMAIAGEGQVGFTHTNKIHSVMSLSKPIFYICPEIIKLQLDLFTSLKLHSRGESFL